MKKQTALTSVLRDLLGIAGATLISIGAAMIYRPAGFIVAGGMLLAWSLLDARAD